MVCSIANSLRKLSITPNQTKFGKLAAAFFLAGVVLLVSTIGSSAALHEAIHPDANTPGHNCAITLFTKGHISAAGIATTVIGSISLVGALILLADAFIPSPANYRYSSSRAPPACPA
jgi:hypothetical protein